MYDFTIRSFTFEELNREYKWDSTTEKALRHQFGLMKYSEARDAPFDFMHWLDEKVVLEGKTSEKASGGVSTVNSCNLKHTGDKWMRCHWLTSLSWDRLKEFHNEVYYLSPLNMRKWVLEKHNILLGLWETKKKIEKQFPNFPDWTQQDYKNYKFFSNRGCTLNDPTITSKYIKTNGTRVYTKEDLDRCVIGFYTKNPNFDFEFMKEERSQIADFE
jgi:hypothetical protein